MKISNRELMELSIKIEQEGQAFYKKLAPHISDPVVREFLLLMAKDEKEHEEHFKRIFGEEGGRNHGWESDPALREVIDQRFKPGLFPDVDALLAEWPKENGIRKALETALKAEEAAVEFYGTLRKDAEDLETKCLMIELENEEKAHRDYIQRLIREKVYTG